MSGGAVGVFIKYFYLFSLFSGQILLFVMTILIALDVFVRALIGTSTMISQELSGYLLVAITFLGLAYTLKEGRHIRVEILTSRLSPYWQRKLDVAVSILCIAFMGWLTWITWSSVAATYATGQRSITPLQMPMWIVYFFVPFGSGMLTLALLIELFRKIGDRRDLMATDSGSEWDLDSTPRERPGR